MKELFEAIEKQDVVAVKTLTSRKDFDPLATERHGAGYMLMAASAGNVEIGEILKKAGVPFGKRDALELDALDYSKEHPDFLDFLGKNGINLGRTRERFGNNYTLIGSCFMPRPLVGTVEFLVNNGVKPTSADIRYAKKMLAEARESLDIQPLAEASVIGLGGPSKESVGKLLAQFERINSLLEAAKRDGGHLLGFDEIDGKFRKGPEQAGRFGRIKSLFSRR